MAQKRNRPHVLLTLSPDAIARLDEMASRCGESRSGMVERLIRETEMPRPRAFGFERSMRLPKGSKEE